MKRRILSLILAAAMAAVMLTGCGVKTFTTNEARSGVVRVMAFYEGKEVYAMDGSYMGTLKSPESVRASGTAFGVGTAGEETDVFVTNRHVIESSFVDVIKLDESTKALLKYTCTGVYILRDDYAYTPGNGLDTSRSVPCSVLYEADYDHADLAVLRAAEPVPGRMALALLDQAVELEAGETVYALGYPGSTDDATRDSSNKVTEYAGGVDRVTVTNGIVSLHTTMVHDNDVRTRVIQHTATINHGNSGGPLITADGAVAGVNTWGFGQDLNTGDSQAFAAIDIEYVQDILDDLKIPYDVYTPGSGSWVLPVVIVAVAAVLAAVVVCLILLKRKKKPAPAPVVSGAVSGGDSRTSSAPDPRPRLQCVAGTFAGQRFSLDNSVRIGRDPGKNDLVFPADTQGISGVHCVLMVDGVTVWLKDLGSTYGTFLEGGRRLAANEAVQLRIGEKFYLGSQAEAFVIAPKGGI